MSRVQLRLELARRLPFEATIAICEGREIVRLLSRDFFSGEAARPGAVRFVFLDARAEVLRARLAKRRGHYMPASLLDSQLATLEPPTPEEAIRVDANGELDATARAVVAALSSPRR